MARSLYPTWEGTHGTAPLVYEATTEDGTELAVPFHSPKSYSWHFSSSEHVSESCKLRRRQACDR